MLPMGTFEGFPPEGPRFYAELETNNTRDWWLEHKDVYERAVHEPMLALLDALSEEFGPGKAFRPNRDVRFSPDKSPYKTYQGGFVALAEGIGYYLHLDATGLMVGGGFHAHTPETVARFRRAVDSEASGKELERVVGEVQDAGFTVGGERLKTVPREFPKDHPRAELLKHKSITAGITFGEPDWLGQPAAQDRIRDRWRQLRPFVEWLGEHVGPAAGRA